MYNEGMVMVDLLVLKVDLLPHQSVTTDTAALQTEHLPAITLGMCVIVKYFPSPNYYTSTNKYCIYRLMAWLLIVGLALSIPANSLIPCIQCFDVCIVMLDG